MRERVLVHAHLVDAAGERRFIENTDDDLFAVRGRQNRDTQIDFFAHHLDAETAVLRNAALGDVEAGENLDARGDRELQRFRRRFRRDQFAIDAITQLQRVLKRLDVNVGRLFLDRLGQDQVDDLDDRRVFAVVRQPIEIDLFALGRLDFDAVRRLAPLLPRPA